ncbi:MAG TPA: hypothetical protein PKD09_17965, partial [Aggregatilinea sp.]|uniref:hypothetical protein n=1 Tax=Aggregatilinea sp. TaxID=2806333 RepID=UPI002C20057E
TACYRFTMFRRSPNALGSGGLIDPMQGDFDTDTIGWKIRHVFGGSHANAAGGWRFSYFSTGAGS